MARPGRIGCVWCGKPSPRKAPKNGPFNATSKRRASRSDQLSTGASSQSQGAVARAPVSPEAWSCSLTILRDAAAEFPMRAAWRDVRDIAKLRGSDWPSFSTSYRRWSALPTSQRWAARYGHEETAKRPTQPALRDKTTLRALENASLDGRSRDFWTHDGDGRPYRPTMLALVDAA